LVCKLYKQRRINLFKKKWWCRSSNCSIAACINSWKKGAVKAVFGCTCNTYKNGCWRKRTTTKSGEFVFRLWCKKQKEVEELGIHIGSVVTYQDGFDELPMAIILAEQWTIELVVL
jgi:hypothetical protein